MAKLQQLKQQGLPMAEINAIAQVPASEDKLKPSDDTAVNAATSD